MKDNKTESKNLFKGKKLAVLLMSFVIALSLCITCAVLSIGSNSVTVDDVTAGEVSVSATYTNQASGKDYSAILLNGQTIEYNQSAAGQSYALTLGMGTYTLEVRGAQGGSYSGSNGGKGGISRCTLTITATKLTIYVVVGKQGSGTTGGYNGGGTGYGSGRGGGGATHIAVNQNALLRNTTAANVLIVAGGGGGAQAGAGGAGGGANQSGGSGSGSYGTAGTGGTTSKAGSGGTSGGFGYGGNSATGSDNCYGGAGGGGYYGGGGARSDSSRVDDKGGGGGSGYVKSAAGSGFTCTNPSGSTGSQTGNGYVLITAVNVNAPPTAKNPVATISGGNRGSKTLNIAATTVATDPNSNQTVYFSQGLSNRDTAPRTNNDLWLNSAHTMLATDYLTWQWVQDSSGRTTTLRINSIKRYPRNGVHGSTQTGRLTLYAYVRDNYGSTGTVRGLTNVMFYLTVTDQGIDVKAAKTYSVTDSAQGDYEYRLGSSNKSDTTYDYINDRSAIYNTSNNKPTVFIPQPLTPARTNGFKIKAEDLYQDKDTAYDLAGIKTVTTDANSAYYKIEYHANTSLYGSTGLSDYILIKPTNLRPTKAVFAVLTITAQECETASRAVIGSNNTTLQLTFKIANTRPYYASTDTTVYNTGIAEPLITLEPGGYKDLKISEFAKDVDNNALTYATAANETSIKVPLTEFLPVTLENAPIKLQTTSNYYSVNAKYYASKPATVPSDTKTTGVGDVATGFTANTKKMLAQAGSADAATACVTYSYINSSTLRITARAATQYQYSAGGRKGDFYFMVRIIDAGDTNDTGIWYPIAIKVNSTAPHEPATTANFNLSFNTTQNTSPEGTTDPSSVATASGSKPTSVLLTPISYMSGSTLMGIGALASGDIADPSKQALPFVTDDDGFSHPGTGIGTVACTYKLNDVVTLLGTDKNSVITADGTGAFFDIELVKLYASSKVFAALSNAQLTELNITKDKDDYYSFWGIRVTALKGTDNNYYQFKVAVKDSHGKPGDIRVYVKVDNREVSVRRNPASTTSYPFYRNDNILGNDYTVKYVGSGNALGIWYIDYKIEKTDVLYITPYDLAIDFDSAPGVNPLNAQNQTVFNSNPMFGTSAWNDAKNAINSTFSVFGTTSPSIAATPMTVKYNQLEFGGQSTFDSTKDQYKSYIDAQITTLDGVPCIKVEALSRTSANIPVLRFTVTDGFSSIDCAVGITVRNAAPVLNPQLQDYYKLTAPGANATSTININYREFFVNANKTDSISHGLTTDIDGDSPTFVAGTVTTVAKVGENYYEYIKKTDGGWVGAASEDAGAVKISDYVYASLTKSTQSGTLGTDVIRVEARSSTQLFDVPVYFRFDVNDGYRADPRQPTLYVQVEVINSDPVFITSELEESTETIDGKETKKYTWNVQYNNVAEKGLSRYIINNEELYNSTAIGALPANKKLLFSDPDSRQTILLNPNAGTITADNLVKTIDGAIDENTFKSQSFSSSALIYGKSYSASNVTSQYLDVKILFFEKSGSDFVPTTDVTSPYWAIEITDRANTTSAFTPTQFAIAVKDDHYGNTLYDGSRVSGAGKPDTKSKITIVNFYYNYISPGLVAMHEYYRTNGNAESKTVVSGSGDNAKYMVDAKNLYNYQFVSGSQGEYKGEQDDLKTASFDEYFQYQYFVNIYSWVTGSGDKKETHYEITPKTYPGDEGSGFWYKPIQVGETTASVPLSYLAMPAVWTDNGTTGSNEHVIFATQPATDYTTWQLSDIWDNLTLTDGVGGEWTGKDINANPYIRIDYISSATHVGMYDKNSKFSYWNKMRGKLDDDRKFSANTDYQKDDSIFYEDKLGFKIGKYTGDDSKRPSGNLRLIAKLKTTDKESSVVDVGVDIVVENTAPKISGSSTVYVKMDMSDAVDNYENNTLVPAGYTVKLNRETESGARKAIIQYTDGDSTDVMKFYMPTATDGKLSESGMSTAELKYITGSNEPFPNAPTDYFGTSTADGNFIPNPGYKNFFEVTPATGTSSVIQIIPKAKTQLTDQSELDKYHLIKDTDESSRNTEYYGKVYYPFKILCYDDLDNSGILNGFWTCLTIRVYIDNDAPAFIEQSTLPSDNYISLKSSDDGSTSTYSRYPFTLTKGVAFTVDMTTLIADSDMEMNGLSYMTSGEALSGDTGAYGKGDSRNIAKSLVKDRLVMPTSGTTVNYIKMATANGKIPETIPFTVSTASGSPSSIKFETTNAFKTNIYLLFEFGDGTGSTVSIAFDISYNNEAPTANEETYGSGTLNIVMKNGDSFILHAADPTDFDNDANGGYLSPAAFRNENGKNNNWDTSNNKATFMEGFRTDPKSASQMKDAFKDAADKDYTPGNLGSLVVGGDDAPSTLRFGTSGQGSVASFDGLNANKFTVVPGNYFRTENSLASTPETLTYMPMSVKIIAKGVVTNARLSLTVSDGTKSYIVNVYITVLSSAPTFRTGVASENEDDDQRLPGDITKVEGEDNTYRVDLAYGDTWEHQLKELFYDPDRGDGESFEMPAVYDGQSVNVSGVSTAVEVSQGERTYKTIMIKAVDYISTESADNFAVVKFKVADMHGVQSEEVTIRVYVTPNNATTRITEENRARIELMSYARYVTSGKATVIDLVDDSANLSDLFVYDRDVDAPSAFYDVAVYALYKLDDEGNVVSCSRDEITQDALIIKRVHSEEVPSGGEGKIYDYVRSFFTVQISEEGKQLLFTPNASTIGGGSGSNPFSVGLYIEVKKNYINGSSKTMDPVDVFANVSVENSLPVAVANSGLNYGYPTLTQEVQDEETGNTVTATVYRESDFLAFSGTAGDSLTWKLYNTQNQNYGLFYDHDMLKNTSGRETLTYVSGRVLESYKYIDEKGVEQTIETPRDALSASNPVLSISGDNDTHDVKITIRRKVFTGISTEDGTKPSRVIPVEITCADTLSMRANASADYAKTVILVTVENDAPEFNAITYDQTGRRYYVTYSDTDGYNMYATVRYGESVTVQLKDIITDQDFEMDSYALVGDEGCLTSNVRDIYGLTGSEILFNFAVGKGSNSYDVSTIKTITFTCVSTSRGANAETAVVFTDSTMTAKTSKLNIHLTVGNTAPQAKVDVSEFTLMGGIYEENEEGVDISETPQEVSFNIVDYVTDINGDAVDALVVTDSVTYVYISEIRTDERYAAQLYGPRMDRDKEKIANGEEITLLDTLCEIGWVETAVTETHQHFGLRVTPGVYGTQYFILTVEDGGFIRGIDAGVEGSLTCDVLIKVTVACPISDDVEKLPTLEIAQSVTRTVTPELLLGTPEAAAGYVITDIASESSAVSVVNPNGTSASAYGAEALDAGDPWRITGNYRASDATRIAVTFAAGDLSVVRNFNVVITENHAPVLKNVDNLGIYQVSQLMNNTITIRPEDWFDDADIEDVMRFVTPVKVKVSAYATATMNGNNIVITFLGRGTTDLTFNITDSTGTLYSHTVTIGCNDMPELKGWNAMVAQIQSKPILYGSIFGGILLLIILIIIIVVVVHKKKKMRREIEALLASENELNEEMMRLSAANSVGYQPFAYLGQQQGVQDPGLMLGGGPAPTTNNLQLGSGTGQNIGTTVQALPTGQGSAANTGFTPQQPTQQTPPRPQQPQQARPVNQQYGAPQQPRPQQGQVPPQQGYARPVNPQQYGAPQQQYPRTGAMPNNNVPPRGGNAPGGYSDGFDPDSF